MTVPATTEHIDMGRPPIVKRDRERARFAIKAISLGHSTTMAAQAAGVSRRTIYAWLTKGKQIRTTYEEYPHLLPLTPFDKDYLWFLKSWEKAEYKRKQVLLKRIEDAGEDGKWQANAWLLERLHADEFSTRQQVVVSDDRKSDEVFTVNMGHAQINETPEVRDVDFEIIEDGE